MRSSLCSLEADLQKTQSPLLLSVDSLLRDVFTAQLRNNEGGEHPQRTPLTITFLLLRDVTAYVTLFSAACEWAIT
jgi:hypothetical protein